MKHKSILIYAAALTLIPSEESHGGWWDNVKDGVGDAAREKYKTEFALYDGISGKTGKAKAQKAQEEQQTRARNEKFDQWLATQKDGAAH